MQCADEIKEYLDGSRTLSDQELHNILSRYFDRQNMIFTNVLTPEEIEFIQNVYLDSSSD